MRNRREGVTQASSQPSDRSLPTPDHLPSHLESILTFKVRVTAQHPKLCIWQKSAGPMPLATVSLSPAQRLRPRYFPPPSWPSAAG